MQMNERNQSHSGPPVKPAERTGSLVMSMYHCTRRCMGVPSTQEAG